MNPNELHLFEATDLMLEGGVAVFCKCGKRENDPIHEVPGIQLAKIKHFTGPPMAPVSIAAVNFLIDCINAMAEVINILAITIDEDR